MQCRVTSLIDAGDRPHAATPPFYLTLTVTQVRTARWTHSLQAKQPQNWPAGLNLAPSFLLGDTAGTLWLSHIVVVPGKAKE